MVRYVDLVQGEVFVAIVKGALIVAACLMVVFATPASAQGGGGGGFGFTFGSHNPYVGPKYSSDEDVGGCVWRRQWTVDARGRRILKKIRICY